MAREHGEYQHFFSAHPDKGDYPSRYKFHLVDKDDLLLPSFADVKQIALDTETNGLNHQTSDLVGFSYAYNLDEAFYVPLRHYSGNIPDVERAQEQLRLWIEDRFVYFYNKRFDLRILQKFIGLNPSRLQHFDVTVLSWLTDTNIKMPSLKWSEKHFLGWNAKTFEDLTEGSNDISLTHPIDALEYAASDALGTWHLAKRVPALIPDCGMIARIDNAALDTIKEIEETPMIIDADYLEAMLPDIDVSIRQLQDVLFQHAGRIFNPGSPQQVGQILMENGCAPTERTAKGKISTSAKHLEKIKHPLVEAYLEFTKLETLRGNYVLKLSDEARRKGGFINVNHLPFQAPTGRFATGSDKKNDFFSRINVQSIIKSKTCSYVAEKIGDITQGVLGYSFREAPAGHNGPTVEGFVKKHNIRSAFKPPEGFLWVSIDYNAQELRLPANFSKDPGLLKAFAEGEDPHAVVALHFLGPPMTKLKRGIAKVCNFGLMFLGTEWTIMAKVGCDQETANDYKSKYETAHKTLYQWKSTIIRTGKRLGFVTTFYGRPRRLRHWFSSSNWKNVQFARRSAVNSVVQGTASDVLRVAMIRVLKKLYEPQGFSFYAGGDQEIPDHVDILFHPIVHDEINYCVRITALERILPQLIELMTVQEKGWPVPMTVELSAGEDWGSIFPFVFNEDGKWTPAYE